MPDLAEPVPVTIGAPALQGLLGMPEAARGIVVFAHGSGSGRLSPRNNYVADALREAGLATLLLDLLTPAEERDRANVFDIPLLASRLLLATDWITSNWTATRPDLMRLPIGYFGASTGAGAALLAASRDRRVAAVVSRGGRPDLAGDALAAVRAPTLLIVGSLDRQVLDLNREALAAMQCELELAIVEGATHLFEEPGTLDQVVHLAMRWFLAHLGASDHVVSEEGMAP